MKKLGALLVLLALSGLFVGCQKSGETPAGGTQQTSGSTTTTPSGAGDIGAEGQPAGGAGESQAPADAESSTP